MAGELPNARIPELDEAATIASNDLFVMYQASTGLTKKIPASLLTPTNDDQNFNWVSNYEYSIDEAVIYGNKWYKSLQNVNEGHLPNEVGSVWWEIVSKSVGGGYWEAGVFSDAHALVFYDDIDGVAHSLLLDDSATRPFLSSDLQAEYLAGKWKRVERGMQLLDTPHNAAGNAPPISLAAGAGPGGLILQGNYFLVGVAGTDGAGNDILVGFKLIAKQDNPGAVWANYIIDQG